MTSHTAVTAGKLGFILDFTALFEGTEEELELARIIRDVNGVDSFLQSYNPGSYVWSHVVTVKNGFSPREVRSRLMANIRTYYRQNYPERDIKFVEL